jgi:hypothetical protein
MAVKRGRRDAEPAAPGWDSEPELDRYTDQWRARYVPEWSRRRRSPVKVAAVGAVVLAVVIGASAAAVHYLNRPGPPAVGGKTHHPHTGTTHGTTTITPVSASGFDALNPSDSGDENTAQAPFVLSGNPAGWSTQQYNAHSSGANPTFGNLKAGTGLILDLGRAVKVSSVTVTFGSTPGANVELRAGNSNARTAANVNGMKVIASATNVSGPYTFTVQDPVPGRFLVIWFTQLPPLAGSPGKDAAQIFSVVVKAAG